MAQGYTRTDTLASGEPTEQTTTSTGTVNDFDLTAAYTLLRCNNASDLILTGFTVAGSAPTEGDRVTIVSVGAGNVFFSHQTGSTAANQLLNMATGGNTPLAAGVGTAEYVYDSTTARWRLVNHQGGWLSVAYSAGNFTGSGSMTWSVDSADQDVFRYAVSGKTMIITFRITATDVGGTAALFLHITIPGGFSATGRGASAINYSDAGGNSTVGLVQVVPADTKLYLSTNPQANWTLTTGDNTLVTGTIQFEIT